MSLFPADRLADSQRKIRAPFELDPSLRFYSPQANLDALRHPRVKAWLDFIRGEWQPPDDGHRRVALLIPCTKYKPYSTSREHRAINGALQAAGWLPVGDGETPPELLEVLAAEEPAEVLHTGPLCKGDVYLDRIVMSEPLGLVPYPYISRALPPATTTRASSRAGEPRCPRSGRIAPPFSSTTASGVGGPVSERPMPRCTIRWSKSSPTLCAGSGTATQR
jgi:hypothetical protein